MIFSMSALATAVALMTAVVSAQNAQTAFVMLDQQKGPPQHGASGFIYGMPINFDPNQIPDYFYEGIDLQYGRAGGGQFPAPCRGWAFGQNEYECRFATTLNNYRQTRKFNAEFIILPHDLWGVDFRNTVSNYVWPGTNGNWNNYDAFLDRLLNDVIANNMTAGLIWDIWNEPDGTGYWDAPQQQYLDLYVRTHNRIRSDSRFNSIKISGPTYSAYPADDDSWWTNWCKTVSGNNTIPDQYAWHFEQGGDPALVAPVWDGLLAKYGLPERLTNINEYALLEEMTPSGYAYYIARFERLGWHGLLGIWTLPLYDNFANLLTKVDNNGNAITTYTSATDTNVNYRQAAGWWVYNYYGRVQTGTVVNTIQSSDGAWDVYATVPSVGDNIRMLCGSHLNQGTYYLQVSGMTAVGYPASGTVQVSYYRFKGTANVYDVAAPPEYLGSTPVTYSNDQVTIDVGVTDSHFAYAVEFVRKG